MKSITFLLCLFVFIHNVQCASTGEDQSTNSTVTPAMFTSSDVPPTFNGTNFSWKHLRNVLNPLKVIIPLHDIYNKGYLYSFLTTPKINGTEFPPKEMVFATSERKFKKMFYEMLTKEERNEIYQQIIDAWEYFDIEKAFVEINDNFLDLMTWYYPMDLFVQLLRLLFDDKDSVNIASMVDGYNNNPGGDLRDVLSSAKKLGPFAVRLYSNFARILVGKDYK